MCDMKKLALSDNLLVIDSHRPEEIPALFLLVTFTTKSC